MVEERDPHGLGAHEPGAKMDAGKNQVGLLLQFSRALLAVAEISTYGAKKYSRGGWQHVEDAESRYTDAMLRHLFDDVVEECDQESGLKHAAHLAWNALARLELILRYEEEAGHDGKA